MDADAVLREWGSRSGEFSPAYYAYRGPDATSERLREALDATVGADGSVLELGCSAGRHLDHLRAGGYSALYGVEVNERAREAMAETYPELAAAGTFHFDAIEAVVGEFGDGAFDAVFSVETLQHVHADSEWVFEEIARVAGDVLITVELEGENRPAEDHPMRYVGGDFPLYYRDWGAVFGDLGFEQVARESVGNDTFRLFRHTGQ
ncbi:MAG: class I SAM-dependent methyltransferase [Halobacteriaceae archaeon]